MPLYCPRPGCRPIRRLILTLFAFSLSGHPTVAETWIRWNQQGYAPAQPKVVLILSTRDLAGETWTLTTAGNPETVLRHGRFDPSVSGAGDHSPLPFHHRLDLTSLDQTGTYLLHAPDTAPARLRVDPHPYAALANLPLQHLRMARSGTDTVLWRRASHPGDVRVRLHVPEGPVDQGAWQPAEPARYVDGSGGWYDAGDHIKFTLTTAYTVYHLLLAYELAPDLFTHEHSTTDLPDLLDEAVHGLDYLQKLHPDPDTFIIQVGNAVDHNQGWRLPADDLLDGHRPALAALARVPMASTAAALARGARLMADRPAYAKRAAAWSATARDIFDRLQQPDTVPTAFERDQVNDFYRDNSVDDQLSLAALELAALTDDPRYLAIARQHRPGPGREVGWSDWHWLANLTLAHRGDATATADLRTELDRYHRHVAAGQPWGLPGDYGWGSLTRWVGAANASRLGEAPTGNLFWDVLDYVFGRNPWGVSFLYDERLPNTLRQLYSPTAHLLPRFPTGAFSAGPARRETHEAMRRYFTIAPDDPFERFNTPAMVFYDHAHDFVCQEATIGGQADIILMLTLASIAPPPAP